MNTRFSLALTTALGLTACDDGRTLAGDSPIQRDYIGPERRGAATLDADEHSRRECEVLMRSTLERPAVPGAPRFDAVRSELLARAKAEPVLFVDTPRYDPLAKGPEVSGYRRLLESGTSPWATVSAVLAAASGRYQLARSSLLKDGYLYAENPDVAHALVSLVEPHDLFGHHRIWVQRGANTYDAERRSGRYHYVDGPLKGQRVRLLHLDRMGADYPPPPPLHRDLRPLMYELGFERLEIRHVTDDHIVANLRYGHFWVPSVLRTEGAQVELECQILASNLKPAVEQAQNENLRRQKAVQGLRASILEQVEDGLPFDEPYHEYGHQLDGKLRNNWLYAYTMRKTSYAYNGDRYFVFDHRGRPLLPQVCVDFLTDTFERASGTWWAPRPEAPERRVGKLDFDRLKDVDRSELRQIPKFLEFARSRTEWFDVHDVPAAELGVRLGKSERFYSYLARHAEALAPGDIVFIKGKTPWDPVRAHYHSFFIYEQDPVTGTPIVVAGNAGRPSLRSWETEARRTPDRSIHHRVRPRTEWLESILAAEGPESPLTLVTGRD